MTVATVRRRLLLPALAALALAAAGCTSGGLPEIPEAGDLPLLSEAGRAYQDVLADPRNPETNARIAVLLHRAGDLARAEIFYHRAFLLRPDHFPSIYRMAVVQLAQNKYDAGVATLRHALGLEPDYVAARFRLALTALRMGNRVETEEICQGLLGADAAAPWAHWLLGRSALAQEAPAEALDQFQAACERAPAFGAAHRGWGAAALALGRTGEAKAQFLLARRHRFQAPKLPDPRLEEVLGEEIWPWQALRRGYESEQRREFEAAASAYARALKLDPRCAAAHARLAAVSLMLGNAAAAERHYREAIRLDPAEDDARAAWGRLLASQNRYQEAQRAFREALDLNPAHLEALTGLGALLEQAGSSDEAERLYREALDCQPGYREAAWRLGRLLAEQERYPEAYRLLEEAARVEDEQAPEYLLEIARVYLRTGNRRRALAFLKRAEALARKFGRAELLDRIAREARTF